MNKIIIVSDSTCDLSPELIKENDIRILPLKVCFNEHEYKDLVEITTKELYEKCEKYNMLPKTAAPSIVEFIDLFKDLAKDGTDVLYTGIGSKLSSAYNNASLAINELPEDIKKHIFLVDSENLSTGIGILVLKMSDMRAKGMSAPEIVEEIKKLVPCVRTQFAVKDLTFLHKGGRCSGTAKFFGTLLSIRPILRLFKGEIILSEKIVTRRFEKALNNQIEDITKYIDHVDTDYLFITHSDGDPEAEYIYSHLPEKVKKTFKHIYITKAGCVISSHCGRGTIGILYIKDSPLLQDK